MRKYENRPHLGNCYYQHWYETRHGVYVRLLIAFVHSGSWIYEILIIKIKSVKVQSKQTECTQRLKEKLPPNFSKSKEDLCGARYAKQATRRGGGMSPLLVSL